MTRFISAPDLKGCPFCSGETVEIRSWVKGYYVFCPDCKACGPDSAMYNGAIDAWNKRGGE